MYCSIASRTTVPVDCWQEANVRRNSRRPYARCLIAIFGWWLATILPNSVSPVMPMSALVALNVAVSIVGYYLLVVR